jgi:hypothetical protein
MYALGWGLSNHPGQAAVPPRPLLGFEFWNQAKKN